MQLTFAADRNAVSGIRALRARHRMHPSHMPTRIAPSAARMHAALSPALPMATAGIAGLPCSAYGGLNSPGNLKPTGSSTEPPPRCQVPPPKYGVSDHAHQPSRCLYKSCPTSGSEPVKAAE